MADFGYDCSDYYSIQSEYGTDADFTYLIAEAKRLGIKIILDFVPNHTSNLNEWFLKSEQGDEHYKDFYVWHSGRLENGVRRPPNNWVSVFRGSAWTWSETRQQYYLHQFLKEQPDLNYRNPLVVAEMKNVLRFWMDRGVSGYRIDAVPYLFEVAADAQGNYPDEPLTGASCPNPEDECYTVHTHTQNAPETFDMTFQWRQVLQEYGDQHGTEEKILMLEAYTPLENIMRLFGNGAKNGSQIPFNFELISNMNGDSTAADVQRLINRWLDRIPAGNVSNWVLGNHDNKRIASRFLPQRADLINVLLQTLPGVAVTYYGEELGLEDVFISWEDSIDPAGCNTNETIYMRYSRDPARTPMPWNAQENAGFSTGTVMWLPVSPDYRTVNVEAQQKAARSHLKTFKQLTQLRRSENALRNGAIELKTVNGVLLYKRSARYGDPLVIALNFGQKAEELNVADTFPSLRHSESFRVEVASLVSGKTIG